jgi:hypothetical protein
LLIITFLALTIPCGVIVCIVSSHVSGGGCWLTPAHRLMGWLSLEELVLSGTYYCHSIVSGYGLLLLSDAWILFIVWEVLALCLAAWIAVNYLRELRQRSTGSSIGGCLRVLIKYHLFYFAGWVNLNVIIVPAEAPRMLDVPLLLASPSAACCLRSRYADP